MPGSSKGAVRQTAPAASHAENPFLQTAQALAINFASAILYVNLDVSFLQVTNSLLDNYS
jgi:hypothetical protein